jgi:hypothetical protein
VRACYLDDLTDEDDHVVCSIRGAMETKGAQGGDQVVRGVSTYSPTHSRPFRVRTTHTSPVQSVRSCGSCPSPRYAGSKCLFSSNHMTLICSSRQEKFCQANNSGKCSFSDQTVSRQHRTSQQKVVWKFSDPLAQGLHPCTRT